jgi:hypothetical protein
MQKNRPAIWFFICWLALQTALGQWNHIFSPPQGMHQGAQADRACVAWNYYHENMNFFLPRVSENRANKGVAGMEFPIVNYCAAICYKLFGFHDFYYRIIMLLIVTAGVFAAWAITGFFIQKNLHRLLLTFGWYLSPIFVFYSANFIPDPAALSFSFIAWYYFLRFYFNINARQSLNKYLIFISLAGLIKITFLISHFTVLFLFLLFRYRPATLPLGFPKIKRFLLWFLTPFLPVAAWYSYAGWLTQKTGNIHFLQKINPALKLETFVDNTKFGFNTWHDSIYAPNHIYFILAAIIFFFIFRHREAPVPAMISILLLGGFVVSFILFNNQYRYHDYYYILLFPALFFGMIFLQQIFLEQKNMFIGFVPILFIIGFFYLPITGYSHVKTQLAQRYTEGDYFCQEAFKGIRNYSTFRQKIDALIPKNAQVISIFDPSPNTSLYYLQRRGVRIAADFSPETTKKVILSSPAKYLIINDSARWEDSCESIVQSKKEHIFTSGSLSLWKLK